MFYAFINKDFRKKIIYIKNFTKNVKIIKDEKFQN